MANGYIGKISALVTASTADLSRKLQGSTGEVRKFAASVQSQVTAASRNAQNSLNSIFTPLQKLERALKAANGQLNLLKPGQAAEIRAFVSAAEGINKPLEAAQRQFAGLSSEVAGRFIPALNRAQEAALQVNEQITRTGAVAAQNFREAQRAVEAFAQSQARVAQIDRAATSGRTGREAEFVSPRALQTLREAAALSERASQLSPAALQDGGVARQVQRLQTFRNAIAQTVAEVEEIRLSPQVDTAALAAAERRLDNIVETTRRAQQELEQIVNGVGQSTDVRARLQSQFAVRQAVEEEAAFRQRAADAAERELAAVERLSQAQNRLLAAEIDRRSGAAARRNADSFDAATAGLLQGQTNRPGVFEQQTRTLESELQRTAQIRQQFLSLPAGAQQALEAERQALNNIGSAARDGAASLGLLVEANDRVAASIERVNRREGESTDVRARLQSQFAVRQAVEEEAAFRQRAADAAERELAAVERLSQAQNRLLAAEIDRRSGASARRNAAAFDASTADLLRPDDRPRREFGIAQRTRDSELARAAALERQFLALPEGDQAALEGQRRGVQAFIASVESGGTSVSVFTSALDNLEQGMADVEARAARIRDASSLLVIDEETTRRNDEINRNIDAQTPPGDRLAEAGRRRVRGLTGNVNIDSTPPADGSFSEQAQRDIDALGTRVGAVRQQLETLPNSIRTRFIPELQRAQDQLARLQNSPRATVAEIERIRASVARLEGQARTASESLDFRERFGGGASGFERIFNTQALRGYTAQLDILQNLIGSVSAQARGPAIVAFARLRDAIFRAFQAGTLGSEAAQREIAELTAEAARASAAVAGVGAGGLQRQLNRAGDIGRRGFDRFSLAAQQAAFAVDDFFSVTGGFDQRIRAVGNNLTQLGFIVGGTAGLFVALGAVLTAQAVVGLVRWSRGGAAAEDISKALNERLEKQKRLLQEISSEFNDLAGSLADSAFSQAAKQSQELEDRLDSLIKKIRELRGNTASTLDPELLLLEGRRGTVERSLQGADSVALAAARQAGLRDVERRIQERQAVAQQPRPIDRAELENIINQSFGEGATGFQIGDAVDDRQILQILERRQLELGQTVDSWFDTFTSPFRQAEARRLIAIVEDARRRLETDIAGVVQQLVEGPFSDATRRFDSAVRQTSESLGRAEGAGGATNASRAARAAQGADAQQFRAVTRQFESALAAGRQDEAREAATLLGRIADSAEARSREARAIIEAANASERFIGLLGRFSELNDSILGDVSNAAEQARREAVQAAGTRDAGLSRPDDARNAQSRNERLQRELAQAQERRRDIELRVSQERQRFEQESPNPEVRRLVVEAERARQLAESEQASDSARAQARQRLVGAEDQLRRAFDASPQARQLQAQLDDADRRAGVALGRDALITRGRELSQTDGERAGRELGESVRAINESFNDRIQQAQNADPFADIAEFEAQRQAAIEQAREAAFRQAAPAIFGLADQVANAVLQGPSRAALEATDVSTVEGSRELNRLLRGDDASRDQNLVELQKQSDILRDMLGELRQGAAGVANN